MYARALICTHGTSSGRDEPGEITPSNSVANPLGVMRQIYDHSATGDVDCWI